MLRVLLVLIICVLPGVAHAWNKKWVRTLIFHDKHAAAPWDGVAKYYYYWDDTGKRHRVDDDDRWLAGSTMGLKKLASDQKFPPTSPASRCRDPKEHRPTLLCMPEVLTDEKRKELYDRSSKPFYKGADGFTWYYTLEPKLRAALRPGLTGPQVRAIMEQMPRECVVAVHPWAVEVRWPNCGPNDPIHWAWREGWDATNVPVTYDKTHLPRDQR